MIDSLQNLLQIYLNLSPELQYRIFSTLITVVILLLLRLGVRRWVHRRFFSDTRQLYNWRKAIDYISFSVGVLLVGRIWLDGIQSLATYLGLLSAGIAIALQDLIVNLAGWAYILWRRPFRVGDRIQIGEYKGDVIDTRLFEFNILEIGNWVAADQSTGRIIHIPNGNVFTEALYNYNQGLPFIWHEIPILVTFESDWEKARQLITEIVVSHAPKLEVKEDLLKTASDKRFVIEYNQVKPIVYIKVASSGVLLTMRYLVEPRERRNVEQKIWESVLHAFAQHRDVDFAYETTREYIHFEENPVVSERRYKRRHSSSKPKGATPTES